MDRVRLIVNPAAGGGRAAKVLPKVRDALRGLGVEFDVDLTRSLEHAIELVRATIAAGQTPVTLGGDGLVGAAAGVVAADGGLLGVLPGGRGNDFIRVLGISQDPVEACHVIAHGVEREVDIGECDGRPFIGIASCGFDSDANRIANDTKLVRGNLVYVYGALRALAAWRPATFVLELEDGERRTVTGYSVAAANSKAYGGGMYIAPDAELDDGELDIVYCEDISKRRFLSLVPKSFKGEAVNDPAVSVVRSPQVRVSADRPFVMYADGDPIAELPCTVRARPRALRVLAPAG